MKNLSPRQSRGSRGQYNGASNDDDGLFDDAYSSVVPVTVTGGALTIAAGTFARAVCTRFTPERGTTRLDVSAPVSLSVGIPAYQHPLSWDR